MIKKIQYFDYCRSFNFYIKGCYLDWPDDKEYMFLNSLSNSVPYFSRYFLGNKNNV